MKNFEIIRKLSNVGRILSKIVFIYSIISICFTMLFAVLLVVGANYTEVINKIAKIITSIFNVNEYGYVANGLSSLVIVGTVISVLKNVGRLITSKYAEIYFKKVIADGTPFNEDNSKRLFKLGMILIVVSLLTVIIAKIAMSFIVLDMGGNFNISFSLPSDVILGGLFIFMSYVCKYGAEILDEKQAEENAESVENNEIEE